MIQSLRYQLTWVLLAGAATAILLARLSLVQGILRSARVEGGSMAPTLVGDHLQPTCDDCGFVFDIGVLSPDGDHRVVCPNCGHRLVGWPEDVRPGQRVLIDGFALVGRAPQPWELIAFRQGSDDSLSVKRVVALEGERLAIRDGDVLRNQQISRKSMATFREMAVLVHDSDFRPRSAALSLRWGAEAANGGWRRESRRWIADGSQRSEPPWLTYRHWRCFDNPLPREQEVAILDNDAYNQDLSRSLNQVHDLMLSIELIADPRATLMVRGSDGRDQFQVRWEMGTGELIVLRNGQTFDRGRWTLPITDRPLTVELAMVDHQLMLVINRRTLIARSYEPSGGHRPNSRPFGIAVERAWVVVRRLQVWRDIHYLHPLGDDSPWSSTKVIPPGHCAVLGDNPPISTDSRHTQMGLISYRSIVGKVVPQR